MKLLSIFFSLSLLSCLCFTSCKKNLSQAEYIKWVNDYKNGLHVKYTFSEFVFDIQYQPTDYLSAVKKEYSISDKNIEYYTLKISLTDPTLDFINHNIQTSHEKQLKNYYFSYLFEDDIYLEQEGKKFPCILFHFEQSDLKKGRTFILGFDKLGDNSISKETKFVIDSPYFTSLPIKVKVSQEDIPSIKI